jgi:hypothetical protein
MSHSLSAKNGEDNILTVQSLITGRFLAFFSLAGESRSK